MDQELHKELLGLRVDLSLLVQRTECLATLVKDVETLKDAKKKIGWTAAGFSACATVVLFIFKEVFL